MDGMSAAEARKGQDRRRGGLAVVAVCLLATGCTMCPDPFDYAGPVPNGSVSQNDYAARSNGILPVRATPLPWPPIVDSAPSRPTPAGDADGDGGAMLATAAPLDPAEAPPMVSVLGASLTSPADADLDPPGDAEERPGTVASGSGVKEPGRALWPVSSRRLAPTPSADGADGDASAAVEPPGSNGPASILESRLPKESPRILLR